LPPSFTLFFKERALSLMNIVFIVNVKIPTDKAYGISVVHTCSALAGLGHSVTLIAPDIGQDGKDVYLYYGVEKNFKTIYISVTYFRLWGRVGFWARQIIFSTKLVFFGGISGEGAVITRDPLSGVLLYLRGLRVFFDMHGFPKKMLWAWKIGVKCFLGIIVTNGWKVDPCVNLLSLSRKKILVAPNGFDEKQFIAIEKKETARKKLRLPKGQLALYTGHLYDWKGAHVLAEATVYLPDVTILFVGGTPNEISEFKKKYGAYPNVIFVGQKPHVDIPIYLAAADVLVLPNSNISHSKRLHGYSKFETSPIKLFEYMASGRPIIASDLPSIREIIDGESALLVPPDDPKVLAEGIEKILGDKTLGESIAERAKKKGEEYTWQKRGERIINFINTLT